MPVRFILTNRGERCLILDDHRLRLDRKTSIIAIYISILIYNAKKHFT